MRPLSKQCGRTQYGFSKYPPFKLRIAKRKTKKLKAKKIQQTEQSEEQEISSMQIALNKAKFISPNEKHSRIRPSL